jgi:hypothetical protein
MSSDTPAAGPGLFSRVYSFCIGAGFMALGTQFYIYSELREGNKLMVESHLELEKRVRALEKK